MRIIFADNKSQFMIFKRKIYDELLRWKRTDEGRTAVLIQGARRVGKSTVAEEFATNEYDTHILVDFAACSSEIRDLFNDVSDLNRIFMRLQLEYGIELRERKSAIIFDEVQLAPKARQAIKYLVKDGRYDYIETGSLISILSQARKSNFTCIRWIMKSSSGHWEIQQR